MSAIKEFTTALKAVTEDEDAPMVFSIDGHELLAYKPTDGQLALLMSSIGRHTSISDPGRRVIDFFVAVMDDDSATYVTDRLLSRTDPLGSRPGPGRHGMDGRGVDRPPYANRSPSLRSSRRAVGGDRGALLAVDLLRLPHAKFLNAVYAWCVQYMAPEAGRSGTSC